MITPETVKLADRLPELEKKLVESRAKIAKALADEEKRHEDAKEKLRLEDGAIAAEHSQCARAKKLLVEAVPIELYRARDLAGSAFRDAAVKIKFERDERSAAAEALEGYDGPKSERAAVAEQFDRAEGALQRAEVKLAELKKAQERAEVAVDAAYQKIRREALAAKVERAARG